ncbi:cytochrome P450 [Enemella dayhoffiae]|uniref:Cytochrome P450 n=1 Tax=Enemella dayhoffiae TaxID=2016507 RepID=A0A255H353_9ACTN|nr:cytochrome P450 [Enemella dayhoffiae]OYO22037.1 cytochrome P450 [Enemella dayhoffiae]
MTEATACPVSDRKAVRPDESETPAVDVVDGVWRIRSLPMARAVLRERGATVQAGFNAEQLQMRIRRPILFLDGEEHRAYRAKVARFFAPKVVSERYRGLMEARADALVEDLLRRGVVDLPRVTMAYAVDVAAQVVGLTNSDMSAMAGRLNRFFDLDVAGLDDPGGGRFAKLGRVMTGQLPVWAFHFLDVLPAILARRKNPGEDIISYLLEQGYADHEILIECTTYAAAGMVTTREFISMAVWHLLEKPDLRADYLAAEESRRYQLLHEVLRLEPVVGHLLRRTTEQLRLPGPDGADVVIPSGALVDLHLRQANADVGEEPLQVCPGRPLPKGFGPEVMSFGDGPHRCPGNALAIQEADILLTRLLRHDLRLLSRPRIQWDELIAGYEVRDLLLQVRRGSDPA